jgi:hypothetical protein
MLLEKIDSVGGLVLAAPVYFGLPPAALVGLLDRLLVRTPRSGEERDPRPAVTVTVMGNSKWRGLAEPVVNVAMSLLGFDVVQSLSLVAEGPGEVLADAGAVAALEAAGEVLAGAPVAAGVRTVAGGAVAASPGSRLACPVCRSDFVRLEADAVECPVCGQRGDAATYFKERRFAGLPSEPRWGRRWLGGHVASWIKPSIARYRTRRKEALRRIAEIKRRYSALESGG